MNGIYLDIKGEIFKVRWHGRLLDRELILEPVKKQDEFQGDGNENYENNRQSTQEGFDVGRE